MRLDLFLKTSRLVKRRAVARELIDAGSVSVNGHPAKPAREVRPGDRIVLTFSSRQIELEIIAIPLKGPRRPAAEDVYRVLSETRTEGAEELWRQDRLSL